MKKSHYAVLQALVFALVGAAFTTIYITQPVLPVLQGEFAVNETAASLSISAVILGIALANLPFGMLADRFPIRPLILMGGVMITGCGLVCALTHSLVLLVSARFVQGLFIPSLTTCLAAYLARNLPVERLNVVMGSYVSATVAGGLGGRLLGGWVHPPFHWRYAFVSASVLLLLATCAAVAWLPRSDRSRESSSESVGFLSLLARGELLRIFGVAFGAFFVFSSVFNYLPFYLAGPPFHVSTQFITLLYLSYVIGIIIGPLAGGLSNRIGNGPAMVIGAVLFALAIGATLVPSVVAIALSLTGVCAGFFTIHASAAGSLNRRLSAGRGHANALYVLFYYLGGTVGITLSGQMYVHWGWYGVAGLGVLMLALPLAVGIVEMRQGMPARAEEGGKAADAA